MAVVGHAPPRPNSEPETHRHARSASSKWQRAGNTRAGINRKTRGGETTEIGLSEAFSATDHNQPQTPRRPRNEGVSGSNLLVGFKKNPLRRVSCWPPLTVAPLVDPTPCSPQPVAVGLR